MKEFPYQVGNATLALTDKDHYLWDCSVIYAEGKYHMFSSHWNKSWGFGWNWVYNSEIIHSISDKPEGPYQFYRVVLPRRGRQYFDGMNTHNTCIRYYDGKYYLYYMGTTYGGDIPEGVDPPAERNIEVWNRKRIGLAVADSIYGEFVRRDTPILEPRDCSHWDCTVTTNPAVAILPDGRTYMVYKSRHAAFRWYDESRKKFCVLVTDDCKNGSLGYTGDWGSGFYAESDDCIHFTIPENPKVYSRQVTWADGTQTQQGNMERPWLLMDENGKPDYLFCASGKGSVPYSFEGETFIVAQKIIEI